MVKPDFIVIGAMKSGTTSLYHALGGHPDIGMSFEKETNFFRTDEEVRTRSVWYEKQFASGFKCYGEVSPDYAKYPMYQDVPERISCYLPNVKIVYIVRDPLSRLISHLWHSQIQGTLGEVDSLTDDLNADSKYVYCSLYGMQLERFAKYFPKDRLHVVVFEEMKEKPEEVFDALFQFLDVERSSKWSNEFTKKHSSARKRRPSRLIEAVKQVSVLRSILNRLPECIRERGATLLKKEHDIERPDLPRETKQRLQELFREDVRNLSEISGREFSVWNLK